MYKLGEKKRIMGQINRVKKGKKKERVFLKISHGSK